MKGCQGQSFWALGLPVRGSGLSLRLWIRNPRPEENLSEAMRKGVEEDGPDDQETPDGYDGDGDDAEWWC